MKVPENLRRLISGVFLCVAMLMLVLGLTILSTHLHKAAFILYWLTCFLLTGIAAIIALLDIALIKREQRREQRDLISKTLQENKNEQPGKPSPKK